MRVQPTLSFKISAIIGADSPDLERLCVRILRGRRARFDEVAALELLKAGMKASDVSDGGLDAVWKLSEQNGIGAFEASHLMAMTVNTFAVSPQFFGLIPGYVLAVARDLEWKP